MDMSRQQICSLSSRTHKAIPTQFSLTKSFLDRNMAADTTESSFIDRPGGRWPVRLLGTRGEARPAGWSLHRTGMRAGHVRGFTIISLYGATHVCLWKTYCMLEYPRQLEREWFGRGGSKNGSAAVHGWCRRQCAPSPKHAPTRLPPARPPEALAELLCRRRRRRSNG
jgi:hypothetical protein